MNPDDAATIARLLRCEPETGILWWRERPVGMFADSGHGAAHNAAAWNTRNAGKRAFMTMRPDHYYGGRIFGRSFLAHRIIWKICTGDDAIQIDHINGVRTDNRLVNLRSITNAENARNQRVRAANTTGVTGVSWLARYGKWRASIMVGGKSIHLGMFAEFPDAVAARKAAEAEHDFHPNHGTRPLHSANHITEGEANAG